MAEHGDERAHAPGDSRQREAEVGPVDLHSFAGGELQREERFGRPAPNPQLPEAGAEDRHATRVPERA